MKSSLDPEYEIPTATKPAPFRSKVWFAVAILALISLGALL